MNYHRGDVNETSLDQLEELLADYIILFSETKIR